MPSPSAARRRVTPVEQPTKADEEAMARILADASRRAARLPEETQDRRGLQVVAEADVLAHGRGAGRRAA